MGSTSSPPSMAGRARAGGLGWSRVNKAGLWELRMIPLATERFCCCHSWLQSPRGPQSSCHNACDTFPLLPLSASSDCAEHTLRVLDGASRATVGHVMGECLKSRHRRQVRAAGSAPEPQCSCLLPSLFPCTGSAGRSDLSPSSSTHIHVLKPLGRKKFYFRSGSSHESRLGLQLPLHK